MAATLAGCKNRNRYQKYDLVLLIISFIVVLLSFKILSSCHLDILMELRFIAELHHGHGDKVFVGSESRCSAFEKDPDKYLRQAAGGPS
jgi:hypothetical protein